MHFTIYEPIRPDHSGLSFFRKPFMSKKDKAKQEIQAVHPAKTGSGKTKKLIIIAVIIILCAAIGAGAFFFLKKGKEQIKYSKKEYKNLAIPEEMIKFTFDVLPNLYVELGKLNDEVDIMDAEIKRLEEIETKYPKQKKIPTSEKKNIERLKKGTQTAISKIEKEIETAFVMSLVEEPKGRQYAKERQPDLEQLAKDSLAQIKGTEPEKTEDAEEEPTGFMGKIKSLFKKKKK